MDVTAIVTTTGERDALLMQALATIKGQVLAPRATIIVVDGAPALAESIRRLVHNEHEQVCVVSTAASSARAGVSYARNLGAELAVTEHVAFLDDDDMWLETHLSAFAKDPPDFALDAFLKVRPGETPQVEKIPPASLHYRAFLVANPGVRGSNIIVRRSVLHRVGGFSAELRAFNDVDLAVRLSELDPIHYRRNIQPGVLFRSHHGARLTGLRSRVAAQGAQQFRQKYGDRMSALELARFDERVRRIWGSPSHEEEL